MIDRIQLERFKSYREASLSLAPLTVLIGANASGKSNAIEGIRFLSWLALGRRLDDILSAVQEADRWVRGTVDNLPLTGESGFSLGCTLTRETTPWTDFTVEIEVTEDGLRIRDESISAPDHKVPLYEVEAAASEYSHEIQVRYNNFARGGVKPKIPCTDQQAVFTQLGTPARFGKGHEKAQREIPETVELYRELLEGILFLDPSPRRMREYSYKTEKKLRGDGSNLSSVLHDLCERKGRKEEVLKFIRALPEQDIRDLSFVDTPRNEVMVQLTESFGGDQQTWDAPYLSDGTLRVLAVAAALLSAAKGSLVVIEEIDNGVHPSRANLLLDRILKASEASGLRVLLTTHNPALLDALPNSAIPDVVFCYRNEETGDSELIRLEDLPRYPNLVAQGSLGSLMTRGILDRFVKREIHRDPTGDVKAWLSRLESQLAG